MKLLKQIKFIVVHHTQTPVDSVEKLREFHTKFAAGKRRGK